MNIARQSASARQMISARCLETGAAKVINSPCVCVVCIYVNNISHFVGYKLPYLAPRNYTFLVLLSTNNVPTKTMRKMTI
jgi:hypothetical protein